MVTVAVRTHTDEVDRLLCPPLPAGPGVCRVCRNLIAERYTVCFPCASVPRHLDATAVVSYSVAGGAWDRLLRAYKDRSHPHRAQASEALAARLRTFLDSHEPALALATTADAFDVVTAVPPTSRARDTEGALRRVAEAASPARAVHRRALVPTGVLPPPHVFSAECFRPTQRLDGRSVLLVEDTWVTGARAQSAAYALRQAGAEVITAVVLGRYLNADYGDIAQRLAVRDPAVAA
jgi:hypothetical protein